jgi:hypothetical protein
MSGTVIYTIKMADGTEHDIEGPEGATPADLEEAVKQFAPQGDTPPADGSVDPETGALNVNVVGGQRGLDVGTVTDDGTGYVDQIGIGAEAAKPDTLSGFSVAQIREAFKNTPESMRPGLQDLIMQGLFAGLQNEFAGGVTAIGNAIAHPITAYETGGQSVADAYSKGRTRSQAAVDYARADHPYLAIPAEITGALINPIGASAKGLAGAAKVGAGYGAVTGAVNSNGNLQERAVEGAKGAAIGAVAAPAIGVLIKAPGAILRAKETVLNGSPGLARRIISKAIDADENTARGVAAQMTDAKANGVPMMLADTGDNARGLLAASARAPGPARTAARDALEQRQAGLHDRVITTIERDLGPVANPHEVADRLMTQANKQAAPLYEAMRAAPGSIEFGNKVNALLQRPSIKAALPRAMRIAEEEGVDPKTLGFVLDDSGNAGIVSQEGRFASDANVDEMNFAEPRTIKTQYGKIVNKRGPNDLITFLRSMGGVKNQSGELSHMGITNAQRAGMDFVGAENMIGPIVSSKGLDLDRAGEMAFEAGYFPQGRPTVSEFIEAIRDTHSGNNRLFVSDDYAEVHAFNAARDARNSGLSYDISEAAGPRDSAPLSSYGSEVKGPSWQTFDYVKRGLDDVVETYRDPTTGKLNLDTEGRAVNGTLRTFIKAMDAANPNYAAARAAYAGPVKGIEAMNAGRKALNMTGDDLEARMRDMSPFEKQMFALGTRRAMAEMVAGKGDTANVVNTLIGTGKKRAMLARLFGDRKQFGRFVETMQQEREGFNTFARSTLGSPTAMNLQDDAALSAASAAVEIASHGGLPIGAAIRQAFKFGMGKFGDNTRKQVTALLSETDPTKFKALVNELNAEATRRGLRDAKTGRLAGDAGKAVLAGTGQ